jgi:hypothetical protein
MRPSLAQKKCFVTAHVCCAHVWPYSPRVEPWGIVKLLGMILSPGNSRHFPDAIATDPTLRRPALYQ